MFTGNLATIDSDMEANFEFPSARMPVPIFVGTDWRMVRPARPSNTTRWRACARRVRRLSGTPIPGLTHNGAVNGSLRDSLPFVERLVSGKTAPGSCGHVEPLGPPQKADPSVALTTELPYGRCDGSGHGSLTAAATARAVVSTQRSNSARPWAAFASATSRPHTPVSLT